MAFKQNVPCSSLPYTQCVSCKDLECQAAMAGDIAIECIGCPHDDIVWPPETYTWEECVRDCYNRPNPCYAAARLTCAAAAAGEAAANAGNILIKPFNQVWNIVGEWMS